MSVLEGIVIFAILLIIATCYFVGKNIILFRKACEQASWKRFERVQALYNKLITGQDITDNDIYSYAKDPMTREATFQLLRKMNLTKLFPPEFYTIEKAAESNLANWLEFPTELGACPDEIEHVEKVSIETEERTSLVHYHVYKFKMNHPHWAAIHGWMLGVVGPYFDNSEPYDHPKSTFSRLSAKIDAVIPRDEARWVHENISFLF
jgi:hypothetical protein